MASEEVLAVSIRRHVINSDRPFSAVLDGIYQGISRPDIAGLFRELAAAASYEEFSSLVGKAQGSAGGSYAPVTILVEEAPEGGTRVAYDTVASALDPYHDHDALAVAEHLDGKVLTLLRRAAGATAPPSGPRHPNT